MFGLFCIFSFLDCHLIALHQWLAQDFWRGAKPWEGYAKCASGLAPKTSGGLGSALGPLSGSGAKPGQGSRG